MPIFAAEALNIVLVPAQIAVVPEIESVVAADVLTVIAMLLEVTFGVATQFAFEVITQVTISLFAKLVVVNVAPVATGALFILH